ncbi:ACT domain-containing protein [Actinoallomurus bryophytorum]
MPSDDSWVALVRAPEGLTVVRATDASDPPGLWAGLYGGETAHGLDIPGMLAALIGPLAGADVPVFVASTFHADLVLVPLDRRADAVAALRDAGHTVTE